MDKVISKDGTTIAYDRSGEGPTVILVGGALGDRSAAAPLAALMAQQFTIIGYDRRGRGDSGDVAPYAVEREVEDIDALIRAAGGEAFVYGHSSGALLGLEAAAGGLAIAKLALYEPPFILDENNPPVPHSFAAQLNEMISSGRRGDAVAFFMATAVRVPAEMIAQMRTTPMWPGLEKVAHTLPYDIAVMEGRRADRPLTTAPWTSAGLPTLVLAGGASPPWMQQAAREVAEILPNATYRVLKGQTHGVEPAVLAPLLREFFEA